MLYVKPGKPLGLYEELNISSTLYDLHACPLPSAAPIVDAFMVCPHCSSSISKMIVFSKQIVISPPTPGLECRPRGGRFFTTGAVSKSIQ